MHRMLVPRLREMTVRPPVADVVSAQSPEAALDALRQFPEGPLAVVSDFNLKAAMTGLDLLDRIRTERPEAIRILFSGYSSIEIGDVSRDGVAQAFFEKPLRLDELLRPLESTLTRMFAGEGAATS